MAVQTSAQILLVLFTIAASDPTANPVLPHIEDCFSSNMETFTCRWNSGNLHNLSEAGALRLYYLNKPSVVDWLECPEYSSKQPDECFFSKEHTTIWNNYRVQLRSRDQHVFDESVFIVFERVRPDPPFNLSWVLLNSSVTDQFFDSLVSWSPPESADVRSGWMRLQYELQYREASSSVWKPSGLLDTTHSSVFGLHMDVQYELRIRCRMVGNTEFGDFSDSIYIYNPSKVFRFPAAALLVFGALCLVAILMLVMISKQEKLMVLLLPPIPGPKIRGIDPELLKNGKLRDLSSILGTSSEVTSQLYGADPWVEFIEPDMETADPLTRCLLPGSPRLHHSLHAAGFGDDDSGRSSCCDPDHHSDTGSSFFPTNTLEETTARPAGPAMHTMYTQVSEVRLSGNVVLSPEEDSPDREANVKHKQSLNDDTAGYTSEVTTGNISHLPVYTVVDGVGRQNRLLLTPSSKPVLQEYLPPDMFGVKTQ